MQLSEETQVMVTPLILYSLISIEPPHYNFLVANYMLYVSVFHTEAPPSPPFHTKFRTIKMNSPEI